MTKEDFVALLKAAKVSEEQMRNIHVLMEKRHPDSHQEFLEWLHIPAPEIAEIRKHAK